MPEIANKFDVIVIGVGSMGAAACYYSAKKGLKVLGIEQFGISHENGSHGGQSRLIRQAYFEHPNYVPLLQRAYQLWHELEVESATRLFYATGILYSGMANDFLISGSQKSAELHHLPIEKLSKHQLHHRYPQFNIPDEYDSIFEYNAGFVTPELAIRTYAQQANKLGATIHSQEKVINWQQADDSIVVKTNKATYVAQKLIVTTGSWSGMITPLLNEQLTITRQLVAWINTKNDAKYALNSMPCWGINTKELPGLFYGFPLLPQSNFDGPTGMKLGYHAPGTIIDPNETLVLTPNKKDLELLIEFLNEFIPGCYDSFNEIKHCKYSYTADEHFIVDHLPDYSNVLVAAGFSGHGFKFAPVIGEILADLVADGRTAQPIDFLSLERLL